MEHYFLCFFLLWSFILKSALEKQMRQITNPLLHGLKYFLEWSKQNSWVSILSSLLSDLGPLAGPLTSSVSIRRPFVLRFPLVPGWGMMMMNSYKCWQVFWETPRRNEPKVNSLCEVVRLFGVSYPVWYTWLGLDFVFLRAITSFYVNFLRKMGRVMSVQLEKERTECP